MTRKSKRIYIYALLDPDTKMAFYVGKSSNYKERFKKHLRYAKQFLRESESKFVLSKIRVKCGRKKYPNIDKTSKISKLLSKNKTPKLVILDSCSGLNNKNQNNLENAWMHKLKNKGHILTNVIYPYINTEGKQSDLSPDQYIAKIKI